MKNSDSFGQARSNRIKLFGGIALAALLCIPLLWIGPTRLLSRGFSNVGWATLMRANGDQQEREPVSIEWFERALRIDPQNRSAQRGLGFGLLQKGAEDEAVAAWQQVDNMGRELYHMGRQAERVATKQYIDTKKVDEKITNRRLKWYTLSTKVDPLLRDSWYQIGQLLEQDRDWPAAEEAYRNGLNGTYSVHAQASELRFWLARLLENYRSPRDVAGALLLYDQAIAEDLYGDPWVRAQTHYRRAGILQDQGKLDEAARAYETVIALNPKNYWAFVALSQLLQPNLIQPDLTQPASDNIDPSIDPIATAQAEEYLLRAVEIDPEQGVAYRLLGLLYEQADRLDDAREMYQSALDRNADDVISSRQLKLIIQKLENR